jgi:negative regulator of sigma E activity
VSDESQREKQSRGTATRFLKPLAVGAAVATAVVAGLSLLERRRADSAETEAGDAAEQPADLAEELRGVASDLAATLLDRATDRLERANT